MNQIKTFLQGSVILTDTCVKIAVADACFVISAPTPSYNSMAFLKRVFKSIQPAASCDLSSFARDNTILVSDI